MNSIFQRAFEYWERRGGVPSLRGGELTREQLEALRAFADYSLRAFAAAHYKVAFPDVAREELSRFLLLGASLLTEENYVAAVCEKYGLPTELVKPLGKESSLKLRLALGKALLDPEFHEFLGAKPKALQAQWFRKLLAGELGDVTIQPRGPARFIYFLGQYPIEKLLGGVPNYHYQYSVVRNPHSARSLLKDLDSLRGTVIAVKFDDLKELEAWVADLKGQPQAIVGGEQAAHAAQQLKITHLRAKPEDVYLWIKEPVTRAVEQLDEKLAEPKRQPPKVLPPKALDRVLESATEWATKLWRKVPLPAKLLGGAVALLGGAKLALTHDSRHWLPASALGYRGKQLLERLHVIEKEIPPSRQAMLSAGVTVHELVEQQLLSLGEAEAAEVPIRVARLGIHGKIDVLLKDKIPLELKTVARDAVDSLSGPHEAHASQVNFYAIALGAPYGVVRYVDRDDPNHYVEFKVPASGGRLISDLEAISETILNYRQWVPARYVKWALERRAEAGVRSPEGPDAAFHVIKPHPPEFPGGRQLTVEQVASPQVISRTVWPTASPLLTWKQRQGHGLRTHRRFWPV